MARRRIELGDVYAIDIAEGSYGLVQVVLVPGTYELFFAVYDARFTDAEPADLGVIRALPMLFLARSVDARIHHGNWRWLGNAEVPAGIPFPASVAMVDLPDVYDVFDVTATRRRRATAEDLAILDLQMSVSPMRLELALQAHFGVGEWDDDYDRLRPRPDQASGRFFPR